VRALLSDSTLALGSRSTGLGGMVEEPRARFHVPEWGVFCHTARLRNSPPRLKLVLSDRTLSSTKKMETCMREIMQQVAFVDEATTAAALTPHLQHRIRGALNAAGFESTGRKFSAGDYKGMTKFALVHREAR